MREPILTLGKFEILDAIGSGGMATVYRARVAGPMGFEKPAAVKVLQDDAASDPELVRMFIDEARLGARLSHPNIASVLDFGEVDGRYFLAMEYVDGPSLVKLLKQGAGRKARRLDPAAAVHVAASLLRALAYAHALQDDQRKPMGVVHRDVSPQNVLVDRQGQVKLCDFGIATGSYRAEHTRVGVVKGKAAYMAPEQATGGNLDARTDLYAVGLTLVTMLQGAPAFEGRETSAVQEMAARGLSPEQIMALDAPDSLKAVLQRALAAAPADRFENADAFLQALTSAAPDPTGAGQRLLAERVQGMSERSLRRSNARVMPAAEGTVPGAQATTRSLRQIRILLLVLGTTVLLALILALLGVGLPDPS